MFRTKLTLAALALAATIGAAASAAHADPARHMHNYLKAQPSAARHDPWYRYALSLTETQQSVPFITDTLAPGGKASVGVPDPWYGYAVSLTQAQQSPQFITDTLAPGGGPSGATAPVPGGFDWADAGIGASVMAGAVLLMFGSGLVVQRRRRIVAI